MIVYIGAISVLILFAIMLTRQTRPGLALVFQTQAVPAAIAAVIVAVLVAVAAYGTDWGAVTETIGIATDVMAHFIFRRAARSTSCRSRRSACSSSPR